jgi:hypothetical protein
LTLLALSYKKSKMRAILGPLVYILILSIGRKAIKKIESAKSANFASANFYFVPCVRIISGHPHFAFLLHTCNSVHSLLPNANLY